MKYQHIHNSKLTCIVIRMPTRTTPVYTAVRPNNKEFKANKEFFEREWKPIKNKL